MKRSKEQVMPAIDPELRERINARRTAKLRAFPGIPLDEPGLLDDVIAALEAAAPVADAVEWVEENAGIVYPPRKGTRKHWHVYRDDVWDTGDSLPAAVAALSKRIEGDKP